MSAIGPKQTWRSAPHMSAFGGKADMTLGRCLLLRSLLGVKRTSAIAAHMSAFDPKRTFTTTLNESCCVKRHSAAIPIFGRSCRYLACPFLRNGHGRSYPNCRTRGGDKRTSPGARLRE